MSKDIQLILHVGAHRTGSTSLQWRLDALSDTLRQHGLVVLTPPRQGKRGTPTLRDAIRSRPNMSGLWPVLRQRNALSAARTLLAEQIATEVGRTRVRRLLLSDEQMLGAAFGPDGGSVYPEAGNKLAALAHILPQAPSEIHLVLRSYDSFIRSVYAMMAVYSRSVAPFDNIRSRLITIDHGWPDLVGVLRHNFPSASLILSTLEETNPDIILQRLIDLPTDLLGETGFSPRHLNRAPTIQAIETALSQPRSSYDPDQLLKSHANGDVFDPLFPQEKAALAIRYARDCAAIAARRDVEWAL